MTTDRIIVEIPLADLHESPFNPRQVFTDLEDLAETMKPPGRCETALLVRPRVPPLFDGADSDLARSAATGFEIVFGHRRRRAAELAGLTTLPCEIRTMTDAEARRVRVVENLQRKDVHPFEEAEGFQALMHEDGLSADDVAEQVGKSRAHVYARLKLLQAIPSVRDACLDGRIQTEVALLIARLRTPALQEKALAEIRRDTNTAAKLEDGGRRSYRHIRDLLAEKFTLALGSAIFDAEDGNLVPAAGVCSACPKRSGNAPEFEDLADKVRESEHAGYMKSGGPNLCTDPDCFAAKKAAHLARKAAELQQAGATVVTGNKAKAAIGADGKLKTGFVPLKDVQAALKKAGKGEQPQVLSIIDQRTGNVVKAVKVAELPKAVQPKEAPQQRGQQRDWEAERRERQRVHDAELERRTQLAKLVQPQVVMHEGSLPELRLVARALLDLVDGDVARAAAHRRLSAPADWLGETVQAWLDTLSGWELRALLLDVVIELACNVDHYEPTKDADILQRLAQVYGVATEGTSTPSFAGAGAEGAAADADAGAAPGGPAAAGDAEDPADESQKDEAPAVAVASQKDKRGAKAPRGVRYRCPATGSTWSGKGLQPRWLKVALEDGKSLADFEVTT